MKRVKNFENISKNITKPIFVILVVRLFWKKLLWYAMNRLYLAKNSAEIIFADYS